MFDVRVLRDCFGSTRALEPRNDTGRYEDREELVIARSGLGCDLDGAEMKATKRTRGLMCEY
jgi:hypothetical protein